MIEAQLDLLAAHDGAAFAPFAGTGTPVMIPHLLVPALDPRHPTSLSPAAVAFVRGRLGLDGLVFSDDLCMVALDGPAESRARAAIAAGCDVALHCSGNMAEMTAIAEALPPMTAAAHARWVRASALASGPGGPAPAYAEFVDLLSPIWQPR